MQQMIKNLITTGYSELANDLYDFVERRGVLPTQDQIMHILNESNDFDEIGHKLNYLFVESTKEALLTAFSEEYHDNMRTKLVVTYEERLNSDEDEIGIMFYNRILDYADTVVLEDFYLSLKNYEQEFLVNNLSLQKTFAIHDVPQSRIDQLLMIEGVDSFLYQTVVEPTDDRAEETYILHLGLMMQQYKLKQLTLDKLNDVHNVVRALISYVHPDNKRHPFNADFIVMTVKKA